MDTKAKAQILSDLYMVTKSQEAWQEFHKWADMGVPLSLGVVYGYCTLSSKGVSLIDSTFAMLLKVLEVPDGDYADLQAVFKASEK